MGNLLQQAFEQASRLPQDEQEALAAIILDELKDEAEWQHRFASSQDAIRTLANPALEQHRRSETERFRTRRSVKSSRTPEFRRLFSRL